MELSAVETGVTASHWPSFIMSALLDLQIHSDLSICHLTSSDIILGNDGVLSSVLMLPLHTGATIFSHRKQVAICTISLILNNYGVS